jgi:E3 ubiquitin-protein ligase RFWD3
MLEMRPSVFLPIHQKQIRDMAFSLSQNNILLTASLDKKAVLFNCNGNVTVQTFQTEHPLWSCVWDEVNQYMLYLGTSNGQIISFDIRSPVDPVATFPVANGDSSPVCRLKFVRPTYQSK